MASLDITLAIGINVLIGLSILPSVSLALSLPVECESGKMPTPTYGQSGAVFTVCASIDILATPTRVYEVLLNFNQYKDWNTFVTAVDLPTNVTSSDDVYIGMPMTFHTTGLIENIETTSRERTTYLAPRDNPMLAAWKFDPDVLTNVLLKCERANVILPTANGSKYVSWVTFYGVGAWMLYLLKENLANQFRKQAEDLRKKAES